MGQAVGEGLDLLPNSAGPVQRQMAADYAARRARLFRPLAPPPIRIPPPVVKIAQQRVAEKEAAEALRLDDERSEWGTYLPLVPYDHYIPLPPKPPRPLIVSKFTARQILNQVCEKHGVEYEELIGDTRPRRITNARAEAYFRLREERQLSWNQIGKLMGGKDHTTTYHGYQKHLERLMIERGRQ